MEEGGTVAMEERLGVYTLVALDEEAMVALIGDEDGTCMRLQWRRPTHWPMHFLRYGEPKRALSARVEAPPGGLQRGALVPNPNEPDQELPVRMELLTDYTPIPAVFDQNGPPGSRWWVLTVPERHPAE